MGVVEKISCSICGQTWECQTGCGLQHGRIEAVAELFDKKTAVQIKTNRSHDPFPLYDFAYHLASCDPCKCVLSVPVLTMMESNLQYIGTCPQCGEKVNCMEDVENTFCPWCHEKGLHREKIGHWD